MLMNLKDWKQAVRTPPAYRVGNSTLRIQTQFIFVITVVGVIALIVLFRTNDSEKFPKVVGYGYYDLDRIGQQLRVAEVDTGFNSTYPLTKPEKVHDSLRFRVAIVTDLDHSSISKTESNTWVSYLMKGYLMWNPSTNAVSVTWDKPSTITLKSTYAHKGRGMELSELVTFNGQLLSFDDRSGLVYVIDKEKSYPWIILMDGDGKTSKGFKAEWATVKDEHLYVGSMGKEWTTSTGEFVNFNPMWIKRINRKGEVTHFNWTEKYKALRSIIGIEFPGYMLHESCSWSDIHKRWFFLPRRMSHNRYDEVDDERRGTNILVSANEDFTDVKVTYIGEVVPAHGFSSFKFIPGSKDEVIVALKSSEVSGQSSTFIMAFHINGKILLPETKIADLKFEGFDFI